MSLAEPVPPSRWRTALAALMVGVTDVVLGWYGLSLDGAIFYAGRDEGSLPAGVGLAAWLTLSTVLVFGIGRVGFRRG